MKIKLRGAITSLSIEGSGKVVISATGEISGLSDAKVDQHGRLCCEALDDTSTSTTINNLSFGGSNICSFGGGSSISMIGDTVVSGSARITVKDRGKHIDLTVPHNGTLNINGKRLRVSDIVAQRSTEEEVEEPKDKIYVLPAETVLSSISLSGSIVLNVANEFLGKRLRVSQSGTSTFRPGAASATLESLDLQLSGTARFDGHDMSTTKLNADLSGMANLRNVLGVRGRLNASGMAKIKVKAYAREAFSQDTSGMAKISIVLV